MKLPESYSSFRDLNNFHTFAEDLFVKHQLLLMQRDYRQAVEYLQLLKKLYIIHMRDEEELLIPLYKELVIPIPQGGAIEFFIREHKQILRYLSQFEQEIIGWRSSGPQNELHLVRLFDIYYRFKHLVDHHDTREDTFLYRLLDRLVEEEVKIEILSKMAQNTALIRTE